MSQIGSEQALLLIEISVCLEGKMEDRKRKRRRPEDRLYTALYPWCIYINSTILHGSHKGQTCAISESRIYYNNILNGESYQFGGDNVPHCTGKHGMGDVSTVVICICLHICMHPCAIT
jgi:hypothetical protein